MIRFEGRIDDGEMFQLNYNLENEHTHTKVTENLPRLCINA